MKHSRSLVLILIALTGLPICTLVVLAISNFTATLRATAGFARFLDSRRAHVFATPPRGQQETLEALQGLQSVTEAGVNYVNYAPRVLDAKVKVDRYLATAPKDAPGRAAIALAMREFVLASQDWNAVIAGGVFDELARGREIMGDPSMAACQAIHGLIATSTEKATAMQDVVLGPAYWVAIGAVRPLWQCASVQVADATRLTRER